MKLDAVQLTAMPLYRWRVLRLGRSVKQTDDRTTDNNTN